MAVQRTIDTGRSSSKLCLIFNHYGAGGAKGGPAGFIEQNIQGSKSPFYELSDSNDPYDISRWQRVMLRIPIVRDRQIKRIGLAHDSRYISRLLSARNKFISVGAKDYPWIWFHDAVRLAACRDLIPPSQKVILQSHSPQLPSEELEESGGSKADVAWVRWAEKFAFERANVCVFPNEYALPIYESLITPNNRIEYVLSGSRQMVPRYTLPLDPQNLYFLYIGRRNSIKGFDLMLDAFKLAYAQDANIRLLVVGGGEPIDSPGILDIGSSEDPASWLSMCDYIVNANRQSYFDLSLLEALSLGTPVILTATGGHQYFLDKPSPGMTFLDSADVEPLCNAFLTHKTKRADNTAACVSNLGLYNELLTPEQYRGRLNSFLSRIMGG